MVSVLNWACDCVCRRCCYRWLTICCRLGLISTEVEKRNRSVDYYNNIIVCVLVDGSVMRLSICSNLAATIETSIYYNVYIWPLTRATPLFSVSLSFYFSFYEIPRMCRRYSNIFHIFFFSRQFLAQTS